MRTGRTPRVGRNGFPTVGQIRFILVVFLCLFACHGDIPMLAQQETHPSPLLRVADFDRGVQNHVRGFHNASEQAPSSVSIRRVSDVFRGDGGRSLRITARQEAGGFAAAWVSFHDFHQRRKTYLDTRGYSYLSFWVRGAQGGEEFRIKLADDAWAAREDGLSIGSVSRFLPGGVTGEWREVLIPLDALPSLNRKAMAYLTFDFPAPGAYTIFIDDISYKRDPGIPTPLTPKPAAGSPEPRNLPRAMWHWNPLPLLQDPSMQEDFFRFCRRERIRSVWLQLPTRIVRSPGTGEKGRQPPGDEALVEILHPAGLRSFLASAHRKGIRVEALDGAPEYSVRKNHRVSLAIVDAVISFNRASKPEERFDGVHFDNEPYLLLGWHIPEVRKTILTEFLELNFECQKRIRARSDMVYGIDIPFWFQSIDPETGNVIAPVSFRGVEKAASFHLIDMLDSVGVMNYRNVADGADGMLAHGLELLEYAKKSGKAKVYLGVETITEPPVDVWFALGRPRKESVNILRSRAEDLLYLSRINGFRLHVLDDGARLHFGVALPSRLSADEQRMASDTLVRLARLAGVPLRGPGEDSTTRLRKTALEALVRSPEWKHPKTRNIPLPSGKKEYAGFQATNLLLPKITFGYKPVAEMKAELTIAEEEFDAYEQYAGIAIHHYGTYRRMVESALPGDSPSR